LALQTLLGTVLETSSSFSCGCTSDQEPTVAKETIYERPQFHSTTKDNIMFVDEKGYGCEHWRGFDCTSAFSRGSYTSSGQHEVIANCPEACGQGVSSWAPMPQLPNPARY